MVTPLKEALIASSVFATLALPFCVFRLWIRIGIRRVGWDDTWAAIAFFCGMMTVISSWIYVIKPSGPDPIWPWVSMFAFTILLWAVRISIILSIIRFTPSKERFHTYGLVIVSLFFLGCVAFVAVEAVHCGIAHHRFQPTPSTPHFVCDTPLIINLSTLLVGVLADVTAVIYPICVLRRMTLHTKHFRLLRLLFSSILVVSVVCSVRAATQFVSSLAEWSDMIDNFQTGTCLIVCNIVVIVTYLYRMLGRQNHDSTMDTAESNASNSSNTITTPSTSISRHMTLTTVDLLFSTPSANVSNGTLPKPAVAPGPSLDA